MPATIMTEIRNRVNRSEKLTNAIMNISGQHLGLRGRSQCVQEISQVTNSSTSSERISKVNPVVGDKHF